MDEHELSEYVKCFRESLDAETLTSHDVYDKLWQQDNDLTQEQRESVHQALELPEPMPGPIELPIFQARREATE